MTTSLLALVLCSVATLVALGRRTSADPRIAADLPMQLLDAMVTGGLIAHDSGHTRSDYMYIYRIADQGRRLLGEQDR